MTRKRLLNWRRKMATRIRTRNDLICWLENNAPRKAIARAVQEGQVENLGAFEGVAPGFRPGWIVKVASRFKKVWYVAVILKDSCLYGALILDAVYWVLWCGDQSDNKLYQGDNPLLYEKLRDEE